MEKDGGQFINRPIQEINFREKTGLNLVAIKRQANTITEITGSHKLKLGDILYVVGKTEAIDDFQKHIEID